MPRLPHHHISIIAHRLSRLTPKRLFLPLLLAAIWLYTVYRGERTIFRSAVSQCDWTAWESWPAYARPHRIVLIADPQLVDPHTYPGRPWPLSALTERYTDRYMARNYRLINQRHDPDSIIFLGDMFDGGREWAPSNARPLTNVQQWQMEQMSPASTAVPSGAVLVEFQDAGWKRPGERGALRDVKILPRDTPAPERSAPIDLTEFIHGENGRWQRYGNRQWESEYKRFGDIFLAPAQLYPEARRELVLQNVVEQLPVLVENGARENPIRQYAVVGSKTRDVLASLPGNHDLGFGSGVQMPVRARYKWHFGDLNRLDVLGNHSLVSIDALSLAAWSQFEANGLETGGHDADRRKHIYSPAQEFIDSVGDISRNVTRRALVDIFGSTSSSPRGQLEHTAVNVSTIHPPIPVNSSEFDLEALGERSELEPVVELPLILLSHVPLYREPNTDCGPRRERGNALSITGGYQYQNVLTRTLSELLAFKLGDAGKLTHIFSGDDHDYCNVSHTYATKARDPLGFPDDRARLINVREETVKSFSWAMGVRRPGFHMVSLWNPIDKDGKSLNEDQSSIQTQLCLLPDQLGIFLRYVTLAGFTVLILLIQAVANTRSSSQEAEVVADDDIAMPILRSLIPSKLRGGNDGPILGKTGGKQRARASSSGLKPIANGHLGVQRSANARARSVSPGVGLLQQGSSPFATPTKSLLEQDGSRTPDVSDDEESRIGDMDYFDVDDSQAKWRRRKRSRGKLRQVWDEFVLSLSVVAGIAVPFYLLLIWSG